RKRETRFPLQYRSCRREHTTTRRAVTANVTHRLATTKKGRTRQGRMRPQRSRSYRLPADLQAGAATDAALAASTTIRLFLDGEADAAAQSPTLARTEEVVAEDTHGGEAEGDV